MSHERYVEDLGAVLVSAVLQYLSTQVSKRGPARIRENYRAAIALRDSIFYRFDALGYHRRLLEDSHQDALATLASLADRDHERAILRVAALQQYFAFDDLLFSAASMFDYFGNLIGLVHYGHNHQRLQWKRAWQYSRKPDFERSKMGNTSLSDSVCGRVIRELGTSLVNKLYAYRSDVIHIRANELDGRLTTNLLTGAYDLTIPAPLGFTHRFLRELQSVHEHPISVIEAADWLLYAVFQASVTLSLGLWSTTRTMYFAPPTRHLHPGWLPRHYPTHHQ